MSAMRAALYAIAITGGIVLAAPPPAAAQELQIGLEELAITGLAIAGGLLVYQAVEDANDDPYPYPYRGRYDRRYDFDRDRGFWPGSPYCGDGFTPPGLRKHGCRPPGLARGHDKWRRWD